MLPVSLMLCGSQHGLIQVSVSIEKLTAYGIKSVIVDLFAGFLNAFHLNCIIQDTCGKTNDKGDGNE